MNNEFLISKLKEEQTIKVIFCSNKDNKKEFPDKITIIGNSPLRKEITYYMTDETWTKGVMKYTSGSLRGVYDFNKVLIHSFLDKDSLKRVLEEEMNIAISIGSLERALELKRELEKRNTKIKEELTDFNNKTIKENNKFWISKLFK